MKLQNAEAAKTFLYGGKAVLTLLSKKSGTRYTYRVTRSKQGDCMFVGVLTAPDFFTYIGMIKNEVFRTTTKSQMRDDSVPVKAMKFFCEKVVKEGKEPDVLQLEVRHEGKCARCARALTVPESIDRGIGPECWNRMGGN